MSTKLTDLQSIESIIQEMTLEEKAQVITGGSPFKTAGLEKYGIPETLWLDGGTGFNSLQYASQVGFEIVDKRSREAGTPLDQETFGGMGGLMMGAQEMAVQMGLGDKDTSALPELGCYPPGIFFGSTWNPEPIEACGHALGKEMNTAGVDVVLGTPNINIHRDPRNGRLFEGYSEDPCLVSRLAPAFVKGVIAEGVIANAKHYAANNQETERMGVNEFVSERALREIYLPGYKACIDAGVQTIMSAYNSINGVPCAQNPWLLDHMLREEWNFDGVVVSDWSAAYDQVAALNAGNDLAMPGPRGIKCIVNAVKDGTLSEEKLNTSVRRILELILQMPAMKGRLAEFDMQEGIAASEFAAREGMILLQNDGTLPLTSKDTRIAFYGKRSRHFVGSGAGSAQVDTSLQTNPYTAAVETLGEDRVTFGKADKDTRVWIVTVGANGQEGADRPHMEMDEDDKAALEQAIAEASAAGGKVVILINAEGPVSLMDYVDRVNAIVCAFYPGMMGGKVFNQVLFGEVNPSGKLPLTWPRYDRDMPTYLSFPGENKEAVYGEGIYVGYRYYDKKQVAPLYPFGYGKSYTTFAITDVQVPETVNVEEGDIPVQVTVKNTGSVDGAEVVQLYIHDVVTRFDKPEKELKTFRKVFLKAGEEKTIELAVTKEDLASYNTQLQEWASEPGEYDLLIGTSALDIAFVKRVNVRCKDPFVFRASTAIGEVAANERAVKLINSIINNDIIALGGTMIVFMPSMPFADAWNMLAAPALVQSGLSQEEADEKFQEILTGFQTL
ncbi:MAG: glycoside hydrolase family 3 C-terminal domain-containing protein [Lachnospiraceae bacterium]|nr:glycoside hydrolase family 3 C-terminal domain-containing protein [Lachnospiraceae bacterium]